MRIWPKHLEKDSPLQWPFFCFFICLCVYLFLSTSPHLFGVWPHVHTYVCVCVQLLTAVGLSYLLQTEWFGPKWIARLIRTAAQHFFFQNNSRLLFPQVREGNREEEEGHGERTGKKKNQIKKIKYGFSLEEKAKMKDDDHLSICPLRLPGKNFA